MRKAAEVPASEVVGVLEIAKRLGVRRGLVSIWVTRGWPNGDRIAKPAKPPAVVGKVSGQLAYLWRDVERWANATGRQ